MPEYQHALELAAFIEAASYGEAADGLHLGPTDLALAAKSLRALAEANQAQSEQDFQQ